MVFIGLHTQVIRSHTGNVNTWTVTETVVDCLNVLTFVTSSVFFTVKGTICKNYHFVAG